VAEVGFDGAVFPVVAGAAEAIELLEVADEVATDDEEDDEEDEEELDLEDLGEVGVSFDFEPKNESVLRLRVFSARASALAASSSACFRRNSFLDSFFESEEGVSVFDFLSFLSFLSTLSFLSLSFFESPFLLFLGSGVEKAALTALPAEGSKMGALAGFAVPEFEVSLFDLESMALDGMTDGEDDEKPR
jgi:hypothetical protein